MQPYKTDNFKEISLHDAYMEDFNIFQGEKVIMKVHCGNLYPELKNENEIYFEKGELEFIKPYFVSINTFDQDIDSLRIQEETITILQNDEILLNNGKKKYLFKCIFGKEPQKYAEITVKAEGFEMRWEK